MLDEKEKITDDEIFEPDLTPPAFGAETIEELTGGKGDDDDDGEVQ